MDTVINVASVETVETRGGNSLYVLRDEHGNEYTTFRERIGNRAAELEGQRARIEYHEEQRGRYTNVYVDKIEQVSPEGAQRESTSEPEEAAWRTAVDAAPWLVGESDPHAKTSPEELYETLKPFKDRVAEDIKENEGGAA